MIRYTSVSISKTAFAKIVLSDRHANEKWGLRGLPSENFYTATPSRTSENALFAKWNIKVFIIDLHAKEEKLIPQPSYADVSFLLLHTYTPML